MKERPILVNAPMVRALLDGRKTQTRRVMKFDPLDGYDTANCAENLKLCPYGQPGDRLWVRETWNGSECKEHAENPRHPLDCVSYLADFAEKPPGKWRPSIFMPRWASRITLEVTGVRVERVQEISDQDAIREGIIGEWFDVVKDVSARASFARLWDSINAKRGYGWAANPWAWVVGFKREEAAR